MFTGIVESVGLVQMMDGRSIEVSAGFGPRVGESVSVSGVCLTVASVGERTFRAALSEETSIRSTLGALGPGDPVNLERAMPADGRFGGHIVQGHVDGVSTLIRRSKLPVSVEMWFTTPDRFDRYIVEKGSVTLDGVSLTVTALTEDEFAVAVIPHTLEATTLGTKQPGGQVNVEVDIVAKYVEKLVAERDSAEYAGTLFEERRTL